jgi:hypothetical protein
MAGPPIFRSKTRPGNSSADERAAGSAHAAQNQAGPRLFTRRQPSRLSRPVAPMINQMLALLKMPPNQPKKRPIMKPVIRYRNQLLFRKSYNPNRFIRIKPSGRLNFVFRPLGFGLKPRIKSHEG